MANPNPGSGGQPTRNVKTLFDRSKFINARKPTTINISNSINPVPQVPGQNTYPPARGPRVTNPQDRGLSIADLRARQLPTLSARQLTGLLFSPNSSTENQRAAMGQTASVPIRQHTFALPPIPAPYERPVAANEDVIPDDNDDDDDDDNLFTGDVDESAVGAEEPPVTTEQASRAFSENSPESPNEVLSSLESDGDSDAGVITYDDVAACDNDVITDDGEGEGEDFSREPPKKSNKRKRDLEAILGPDYRPSDDSEDDSEDDLDDDDSDDSERRAAKRAKARGKRPAFPPLPPRSPTPPELQASEGRHVPNSFAEMSEADKVMFEWWESGEKGWAAITHEVNRLTGGNEDNMEIATRYEILRRYLHGKEKIIIEISLQKAYEEVDQELFRRYGHEGEGMGKYWQMRWFLVREAYWELERIPVDPKELRDRWVGLNMTGTPRDDPYYDWTPDPNTNIADGDDDESEEETSDEGDDEEEDFDDEYEDEGEGDNGDEGEETYEDEDGV